MKIKSLFAIGILFAIASTCFGQSVLFQIETGMIKDVSGSTLTISDPVFVYGGTFDGTYSSAQLEDAIESIRSTALVDPDLAAVEMQTVVDGFDSWGQISASPKNSPATDTLDWFSTVPGTDGAKPYMLILTDSVDSIIATTQIGIVSAAGAVIGPIGFFSYGFTTPEPDRWDQAYMGTLGSLTLEAIPEPRAYAALFGVCVLALAVIRRRRK